MYGVYQFIGTLGVMLYSKIGGILYERFGP